MARALHILALALLAVGLAVGLAHAGSFRDHAGVTLAFPYPLDGQEGTLLHEARLILAGEPLYQPLQLDRVVGAPYPPIHALALAGLEAALHGADWPRDVSRGPVFNAGRLASVVPMVLAGGLLALGALRGGGGPFAPLALLLWLAHPSVQLWSTRIKPDPLALCFTAGGLLAVAWHFSRQERGRLTAPLAIGAALFAAAFFTKQTAVAAPAATLVALVLDRGPWWGAGRRPLREGLGPALAFGALYAGLVGGVWVGLDLLTRGQFTYHVWGLHPPGWFRQARLMRYLALLLELEWPLLIALGGAALAGAVGLVGGRGLEGRVAFPLAYAALGTGLVVGAGTLGSHHNHLLEPWLALVFAVCALGGQGLRRGPAGAGRPLAAGAGALAAALVLTQLWSLRERPAWYGGEFDMAEYDRARFVDLIRSQPGEVLADDVGLLLAVGRLPRYNDPPTMGPAAMVGLWDQSGLLREVAEGRFSLILLPGDIHRLDEDPSARWTPEFLATLRQHYRVLYRDELFSYVPRGGP